ncbi:hypothetical protein CQA63_09125 [Helicobacter marmotae]|uniref:site-specific DNA-methyltransferase (adenine-specific) n=1 Tax=Helicobacter marmotae TaxID=152490 RepID=A0A3D8I117_9HELI|nr:hypothetical protein CQA63_09125 [Helicobacter marmotae]
MLGHEKIKSAKTQLQELIDTKQKDLQSLQKAFSTEPLSKEFYREYFKLFQSLCEKLINNPASLNILQGYEGLSEERAVRAFVKKLLGRIVFLYFLQKKGWLGVDKTADWGSGDREFLYSLFKKAKTHNQNFYKDYLCPLFFDSLNTQREGDYFAPFDCKIPFLNGGLFEEQKLKDAQKNEIGIETHLILCEVLENSDFEEIFNVFEHYNFTIEESTPSDEEIGIDPEMLGQIFENLIDDNQKRQRDESGKSKSKNKVLGAYYTPKHIVHLICKNALMRTLQEKLCHNAQEKDSIYSLVFTLEVDDFITQKRQDIIDTLKNLTILDPAIGSGAFPMGLLSEILQLLSLLTHPTPTKAQIATLKRAIIQKQIYGIDIDSDAIEIAKLRFYLSIAVDEQTPTPLPNLDFNFMQGNSLLERLGNIEIIPSSFWAKEGERDLFGDRDLNASLFDESQSEQLSRLFINFFNEKTAQKKKSLKQEIINIMESTFNERIAQIDTLIQSQKDNPKVKKGEIAAQQKQILQYEEFKQELKTLLKDYKDKDFHSDKLFLYRFFFASVFAKGGFDLCVGNPPYIRGENIDKELKPKLEAEFSTFTHSAKGYPLFKGNADIYTYFYAKGLSLLKPKGFLSFITSNKWCRGEYGENLRRLLIDVCVDSHIDLNGDKVFKNATVDTAITTLQNTPYDNRPTLFAKSHKSKDPTILLKNAITLPRNALSVESFLFLTEEELALKAKIEAKGVPLKDWDININYGIKTGCNDAFIIGTNKREEILSKCDDSKDSLLPYPLSEYDKNLSLSHSEVSFSFLSQKGVYPPPVPLNPEKDAAFSANKGEASLNPLLVQNRSEGTTASLASDFETPRSGREESLGDSESTSSRVYPCCDKIKSHEVPPLKASSGWGIYKGARILSWGWTSRTSEALAHTCTFKPLPLIEKETARVIEKTKSVLESSKIDLENNIILLTERERTAQLIKPLLKGENIKRYSYEWAGWWLIGTFPALKLDIDDYPAVKNYLATFGKRLEQSGEKNIDGIRGNNARKKTSNKWFETQDNIAYYDEFAKPKIVWNPVSGEYFFAYIKEVMYMNNSLFMITHKQNKEDFLLYVLGCMNSTLYRWLITQMTNLIDEGKYAYGAKDKLEKLPIPKISKNQESELVEIVCQIIESKKANKDTSTLEKCLDSQVFALYDLSNEEINIITGGGDKNLVRGLLLISIIESKSHILLKLLCENFESELKEAFRFCEGLKVPYNTSKEKYEGKIIWAEMTNTPCFIYDEGGYYINQTCYFIPRDDVYLVGVLNSKLIYFYMKQIASSLGDGAFRWIKQFIEKLPIIKQSSQNQAKINAIKDLGKQIITQKGTSKNTDKLEARLDSAIYELYGLSQSEIELIESSFERGGGG